MTLSLPVDDNRKAGRLAASGLENNLQRLWVTDWRRLTDGGADKRASRPDWREGELWQITYWQVRASRPDSSSFSWLHTRWRGCRLNGWMSVGSSSSLGQRSNGKISKTYFCRWKLCSSAHLDPIQWFLFWWWNRGLPQHYDNIGILSQRSLFGFYVSPKDSRVIIIII